MNFLMQLLRLCSLILISFILSSCADSGGSGNSIRVKKTSGYNANHGPFDSRGNYVEAWADTPPRRIYVDSAEQEDDYIPTTPTKTIPTVTPPVAYQPPRIVTPTTKPTNTVSGYTPPKTIYKSPTVTKKPTYSKPKTTYVKPPKAKAPIIHIVKKGDTLYSLARKYKSGVKTIQIANGLKGSVIRIGQSLKIPRY